MLDRHMIHRIRSAFQNIVWLFERHGFVLRSVLVVHFLIQKIVFILVPILSHFSQNIVQSDMALCYIVTHILLLVQCFQILEYVVRCLVGQIKKFGLFKMHRKQIRLVILDM